MYVCDLLLLEILGSTDGFISAQTRACSTKSFSKTMPIDLSLDAAEMLSGAHRPPRLIFFLSVFLWGTSRLLNSSMTHVHLDVSHSCHTCPSSHTRVLTRLHLDTRASRHMCISRQVHHDTCRHPHRCTCLEMHTLAATHTQCTQPPYPRCTGGRWS